MLNLSDRPGGYTQLTGHNQFIQATIPGIINVLAAVHLLFRHSLVVTIFGEAYYWST